MEYLIIFSVAFMMTLPLLIIYAKQTGNVQADVTQSQMYTVSNRIRDYAEQVYYMGEPSERTLIIDFPRGINSVTLNGTTITFHITTTNLNYDVVEETSANLTGSIRSFPGEHVISFTAQDNDVLIIDN